MNEVSALNDLFKTLDIQNWWKELLTPQDALVVSKVTPDNFDQFKAMDTLPRTEIKAAKEIKRKFGASLSYNAGDRIWYLWDGRVHAPCDGEAVAVKIVKAYYDAMDDALRFVKDCITREAQAVRVSGAEKAEEKSAAILASYNKGEWTKHRSFRDRMSSDAGQAAVVRSLMTEVDILSSHFDGDRKFLVVRNGVIDIAKFRQSGVVTLEPHDPARPVFRYFDADYDPEASEENYPRFRTFLSQSIIDWDTAVLLQKAVGAAFSAPAKPRMMINLLGKKGSGKSMFLSIFESLGQGYTVMPDNGAIQVFGGDTNHYKDELYGGRFIGFSEVQGNKPLNDGFIKQIMGGDKITSRRLYGQPRKWYPQGIMFVASNSHLQVDFRDDATMSKIFPITFPYTFSREDPDHQLDEQLQDKILGATDGDGNVIFEGERSGLLHWVLKGMLLYWKEGLVETESVLASRDDTKVNSSYSLKFMSRLLETGMLVEDVSLKGRAFALQKDCYDGFKYWCEEQNVKNVPGKQTFNADIEEFYHGSVTSDGKRFRGLAVTPTWQVLVSSEQRYGFQQAMLNLEEREAVTQA